MNCIPLSLYIHIPWCIKKCPYCDFNSHVLKNDVSEDAYVKRLVMDLEQDFSLCQNRSLQSIFIGGGTPSLFSAEAYAYLLSQIFALFPATPEIEITLEANPGTFEQQRFQEYRDIGINRLSIGCQSFDSQQLQKLGRIHNEEQAFAAIDSARVAGFDNINLDLMFALPKQSITEALKDLQIGIDLKPNHLSWYQLTLEPNTVFHKYPPNLPQDDDVATMMQQGKALLRDAGFNQYEVSAYAKPHCQCLHNLNYWQFGDYLGIGAGAHGKITDIADGKFQVLRTTKYKMPQKYLQAKHPCHQKITVASSNLPFEFMLNALRLQQPISKSLFEQRTGLSWTHIGHTLNAAQSQGLVKIDDTSFTTTDLGKCFVNDIVTLFL